MAEWTWQSAAMVAAVLLIGSASPAAAADSSQVLDCIKRVGRISWSGHAASELVGAVACMGISGSDAGADAADFDRKVKVISECFDKVSFKSKAKGLDGELNAATACVGAVDAEETVACMEKVSWKLRYATGVDAETIAAQACARGNPAAETAECVGRVAFRLDASGILSEYLAAIACGR